MVAVIVATVLGFVALAVDRRVDGTLADLPLGFTSTVESARTVLGVIAGATISFADIAFSVSLLIIQLGSSQYSPRVVCLRFVRVGLQMHSNHPEWKQQINAGDVEFHPI